MQNKTKGKLGEDLALQFVEKLGYEVLERNFRFGRSEIDLIALDQDVLVFIEVKMRSGTAFGEAETFVTDRQIEKIQEAAEEYQYAIDWKKNIRFDIITIDSNNQVEHFEDAF